MRYIKMLSLLAMAAVVAMAFAATTSATQLTSPGGTVYAGNLAAKSQEGGITLHGTIPYTCNSHAEGEVQQQGASQTAIGIITSWAFENCSGGHVTIIKKGSITIHTQEEGANGNGTVTSSGAEVQMVNTSFGITCVFSTSETPIGTLTGSNEKNAVVNLEGMVPRTGGSVFCGSASEITGAYEITTPSTLSID